MRFRGLAANDPSKAQYQLWIFDAERPEAYPVDGGVFDVPESAGGDVVVRIEPRLPISQATAFAITVEQPGGVVVSSRERLPLLAALPGADSLLRSPSVRYGVIGKTPRTGVGGTAIDRPIRYDLVKR